jgi:hypothetical protein
MPRILLLLCAVLLVSCDRGPKKCSQNRLAKGDVFCDTREGKVYKYANINGKTWMAENLKYGKRTTAEAKYTWAEALKLPTGFNEESYYNHSQIKSRQGICPKGWRLPSDIELNELVSGTEDEFSIWSTTQNSAKKANVYSTKLGSEDLQITSARKSARYAIRCVKNNGIAEIASIASSSSSSSSESKEETQTTAASETKGYECQSMDLNSRSPLSAEEKKLQENIKINDLEYAETIYTSTFNNAPETIRNVVTNIGSKPHRVTFQYWLNNGFSEIVTLTKDVPPGSGVIFEPNKELNLTKSAFAIKSETKTTLQTCAYGLDGRKVPLLEQSNRIKLIPPQFFNWSKPEYIAAFATYQMDSIPALQSEIARKAGRIMGYQQNGIFVEKQIKAAYEVIAARKWHYFGGFVMGAGQKIRYPVETMRERSANCIEGALLLSAIMESMDLRTGIVLVPGHAFLAWKSQRNGDFDRFIETTMAFDQNNPAKYEQAAQAGMRQFIKHKREGTLQNIIDIRKMWNLGISLNQVP